MKPIKANGCFGRNRGLLGFVFIALWGAIDYRLWRQPDHA